MKDTEKKGAGRVVNSLKNKKEEQGNREVREVNC